MRKSKEKLLTVAVHTEMYNGGIEQGLLEIIGKDNLKPEDQQRLDLLQKLPRDRGLTNDGKIIDLRTGEVVGDVSDDTSSNR